MTLRVERRGAVLAAGLVAGAVEVGAAFLPWVRTGEPSPRSSTRPAASTSRRSSPACLRARRARSSSTRELGNRLQKANLGLLAVQEGGRWYVSPTRTVVEVVLQMVKTIDRTDLQAGGFLYDLITNS